MSLFVVANHMLVLYSLLYLIGDFLRAFFYRSDSSSDAVGISVLFFFLSIWLFLNSIIYFRAFMHELETYSTSGGSSVEGTGVASANTEMTVGGGDQQITSAQSKNETTMQIWKRWTYYLRTEVGLAYFLNIVGSAGYVLSSLISMFLTMGTTFGARDVDRASLFLDSINMTIFIIDGFLFWHVWYKESDEPTLKLKCLSVYMWANVCNTASSIAYFCIICWALNARFVLAANEKANLSVDPHWYDNQLIAVIFKQRTMYFVADLVYLLYAILLEVGWFSDSTTNIPDTQLKSIQLPELSDKEEAL